MILIDANVFMYAVGAEHPNKQPSIDFLARVARGELQASTDAEVLQEILHRYRALNRWADGRRAYDLVRSIIPVIIPITSKITDAARMLLDTHTDLAARDALHAAVCRHEGAEAWCSYDRDFDAIPGVDRREPEHYL